ncbi:MAG: TetR/AcrR family transcriptional regulator [Ruminococcus sp.]|nr:TetR/AcrR family transcriptional regulator [Ruminococcus sp.]
MAGTSTKEKLVAAALDLFSKKGYSATSVDEIAESIGIKGPNLYKYFKGKEALFKELSELSDQSYLDKMNLVNNKADSIEDAQGLKAFAMGQVKYTMYEDMVIKLRKMLTIEQFRSDMMKHQTTIHQYTNINDQFTRIMKNLIKNGSIAENDPALLALEFTSVITVLIQLSDREPEKSGEVLKLIERHIDHFIDTYFLK